jgi:ElaA protein
VSAYDVRVQAFDELDARTAYRIWQLRESVFVVEQECAYQELDGRDLEPGTRHVWASPASPGDAGPVGYLRVLDDGAHVRIGRVLVGGSHRGRGLADELMRTALGLVGARPSRLDAQRHLAGWYTRFGYVRDGEDFLDDGIWHVPMARPSSQPS